MTLNKIARLIAITAAVGAVTAPGAVAATTAPDRVDYTDAAQSCRTSCLVGAPTERDPTAGGKYDKYDKCAEIVKNTFVNQGYDTDNMSDIMTIGDAQLEMCSDLLPGA